MQIFYVPVYIVWFISRNKKIAKTITGALLNA